MTHGGYAVFLNATGRFDEAEAEIRRTLKLNPLSPIEYVDLAVTYLFSGQHEKAREQASRAAELDPDFPPAYQILGLSLWRDGKSERAIESLYR